MPQATGITLNLADTLEKAKVLDKHLDNWVNKSEQVEKNLRKAFSAQFSGDNGAFKSFISEVKNASAELYKMKFMPNANTDNLQQYERVFKTIIDDVAKIGQMGKVQLFDVKHLYDSEERITKIMIELQNIRNSIGNVSTRATVFESALAVNENGKMAREQKMNILASYYGENYKEELKNLNIYENTTVQTINKILTQQLEADNQTIQSLNNKKKIYQSYYNWLIKTESERAEKVQQLLNKELSAEQRQINAVRAEYKKLLNDLATVESRKDKYASAISGAKSTGATVSPELQRQYNLSIQSEQEMLARKKELETNYWEDVKNIAEKFIGQQVDIQIKEQERANNEKRKQNEADRNAYLRSPQGAIDLSNNAKTINDEKDAIQFLIAARDNLSKSTQDYDKIIKDLNDRIQKHRISVEELTTAEKNENSLQPKVRNEYARLLKELDNIDAAKKRLAATDNYKSGDAQAIADMQALEARYNDVANKKIEIENNAQGKLDEVVRQHEAIRAQERLAQTEKTEAEIAKKREEYEKKYGTITSSKAGQTITDSYNAKNIAEMEKYISKLREAKQKLDNTDANYEQTVSKLTSRISELEKEILRLTNATEYQRQQEQQSAQQDPMKYAKNAKTLEQYRIAIEELKKAKDKLDISTPQGINQARIYDREISRLTNDMSRLNSETGKTSKVVSQLGRAVAYTFSLRQITGYVNKLIEVRGEFELQHRSLQVLIQDADKANDIWDKTIALAIKSPFRVKELVTYTKQLAAYRVEADKLYETNKMLADVSAGLGVDMNRLILAFGQVKAANYLRGTELRQFSEAGVNILDELAQKFSEVEGRVVSVGDVFERVSKRMVSFKDVEEVFQKITSEGGIFYKMQEKQAETLKGMIMNLRDSIDIMLNDIGISNESIIKNSVSVVKNLVDNWRKLIPYIKTAGITFLTYFAAAKLNNIVRSINLIVMKFKQLGITMRSLTSTNIIGIAITALTTIITLIVSLRNNVDELTAKLTEVENNIRKQLAESIQLYKQYADTIRDITKTNEERANAEKKIQEIFKDILPDTMLEAEYIKQMGDNYDVAYDAMMNYYNAKATEQKKDRISQMYEEKIYGDDYAKIISYYKNKISGLSYIDDRTKEILTANISSLFNEAIDAFKNGETNSITRYFKQLVKDFSGVNLGIDDGIAFTRQMMRISKAIIDQKQALEGIDGLPFRTLQEALAADTVNPIKENVSAIEDVFKRLLNMYKDFSKQTEEQKGKINEDAETIISQLPNELKQYEPIIRQSLDNIKANAEQGTFEFNSSLEKMQQDFLNNIITTLKEMSNGDIDEATKQLLDNYIESLEERAKGLDYTSFQNAITDAIKLVSEESGIEVDKFTKYLADKSANRSSLAKSVEADIKQYQEVVKNLQNSLNAVGEGNEQMSEDIMHQTQENVDFLEKKMIPALQHLYNILGGDSKNDSTEKQLKVIDEMHKKYEELRKSFSYEESAKGAFEAYADAFAEAFNRPEVKNMNFGKFISDIFDFTNEDDIVKFLDNLLRNIQKTSEKIKVELKKGEYEYDVNLNTKKETDDKLKRRIENLFQNYDLSKELKDLGLDKEFAKSIFDVDYLSLDKLRSELEGLKDKFIGTDMEKEYKNFLQKISEMEDKETIDRMKTYMKYLIKAQNERVSLRLEEIKILADIDKMEIKNEGEKERMKENVRTEYEKKMLKQQWEDFKGSDIYSLLFNDVNNLGTKTLEALSGELSKMKEALSGLPINEFKDIMSQMSKIEEGLISKDPFGQLIKYFNKKKNLKSEEDLQLELFNAEKERRDAQEIIDLIDKVESARNIDGGESQLTEGELGKYREIENSAKNQNKTVSDIRKEQEGIVEQTGKAANKAAEGLEIWKLWDSSIIGTEKALQELNNKTRELSDAVKSALELDNGGLDEVRESIFNSINGFSSLINSALSFASTMRTIGYASNMALGVIGWIAIATQAAVTGISAIMNYKDAQFEKQLRLINEQIEDMQENLSKLEESMEEAYSIEQIKAYNEEIARSRQEMIQAQRQAVEVARARAEKKGKNSEEWKEWKAAQKALDEMLESEYDYLENVTSNLTDGILDSMKDAAESVVDSWLSAFEEVGDGISGLEENFKDMFYNLVKKQAALQIVGAFAEQWQKDLQKYINPAEKDYELTKEEALAWAEEVRDTFPALNEALTEYLGALSDVFPNESGLSGLEKGIQGITEQQAEVLAAYWNASRQSLANIDNKFTNLLNKLSIYMEDNPMLSQLKIIAKNTANIYDLINNMTASFHSGGRGIKVVM